MWFGAVKSSTSGEWQWSDSSALQFNRWPEDKELVGATSERLQKHDCGAIGHAKHGYGRRFSRPCVILVCLPEAVVYRDGQLQLARRGVLKVLSPLLMTYQ